MTEKNSSNNSILKTVALASLLIGTIGSLYFTFAAGHHQKSYILIGLFAFWVLSPFVGLYILSERSHSISVNSRQLIYWTILFLAIISIAGYSGLISFNDAKPAFRFLFIPGLSWLIILIIWFIAGRLSGRHKNQ